MTRLRTGSTIFGKQQTPWVDENGHSHQTHMFGDASRCTLWSRFRQIVQSMELNAASVGINPADIILSWTVHTQSITPTLKLMRSIAQPAPTQIVSAQIDTSILGGPGLADIYIGVITLPYYLGCAQCRKYNSPVD